MSACYWAACISSYLLWFGGQKSLKMAFLWKYEYGCKFSFFGPDGLFLWDMCVGNTMPIGPSIDFFFSW